jgi:hypothetical protein
MRAGVDELQGFVDGVEDEPAGPITSRSYGCLRDENQAKECRVRSVWGRP